MLAPVSAAKEPTVTAVTVQTHAHPALVSSVLVAAESQTSWLLRLVCQGFAVAIGAFLGSVLIGRFI